MAAQAVVVPNDGTALQCRDAWGVDITSVLSYAELLRKWGWIGFGEDMRKARVRAHESYTGITEKWILALHSLSVTSANIAISDISRKSRLLDNISVAETARKYRCIYLQPLFTALHGMQRGLTMRFLSVCLSV